MYSSGKHKSRVTQSRWGNYRPQYLTLHNRPNPILADYRENDGHWPLDGYLRSLHPQHSWQWESLANLDEIDHARRVLTRLRALRNEEAR